MSLPREIPAWVNDYVGLPYLQRGRDRGGVDCYGLVLLALRERLGVEPPDYGVGYDEVSSLRTMSGVIRTAAAEWQRVPPDQERLGDVVILQRRSMAVHCGLVLVRDWMLHTQEGCDACVERYTGPAWGDQIPEFRRWVA